DLVARHLVPAERALEDDDPDRAHEHTKVARRFAARIGVVREAAGIVAYRAGHFSEALSDLRAARRMTGSDAYLPVMADCERGLGRPERALDLVRSPEAEHLDRAGRVELSIVESGARRDLGQNDAAVITLQRLPELRDPQAKPWSARLAFAYADALADAGHQDAATDWFGRAMAFDEDGETDAAERYAELTGAVIEDVEEDFDFEAGSDDADDSDDGGVVAEAEGEVDEEADDAAAFAEAGDLLDGPEDDDVSDGPETTDEAETDDEEQDDDLADPVDGEEDQVEASLDEAAGATGSAKLDEDVPSAVASSSAAASSEEDAAAVGENDDLPDAPEDAESAAGDGPDGSGTAEKAAEASAGASTAAEASGVTSAAPSINPAFIEPDFGDILDSSDEQSGDEAPKRDK
uniref:hypothetical protein n=1 Tax=Nonomuraea rhizosphaerae TaxID=2665663 RepID=UPI001C5D2458